MNRLDLDFSLKYTDERAEYVHGYLNTPQFLKRPPTSEECETIANYILWGRKRESDKNVVQDKEIQIKTRAGIWDSAAQVESLDGLLEQPGFSETSIVAPNAPKWRYPKIDFPSRKQILDECQDPDTRELFQNLWARIDDLDLELNYYDLAHGKRTKPPRETLLARFTPEAAERIKERALKLSQYAYLKKRHLLVELRREQYTLRDTFAPIILPSNAPDAPQVLEPIHLDAEIPCAPCGLLYGPDVGEGVINWDKVFPENRYPAPSDFTKKELDYLLHFYWKRAEECERATHYFDFRNEAHVVNVFNNYELLNENVDPDIFSSSKEFQNTLHFYISRANLTPAQECILQLKIEKRSNDDISSIVGARYGKTYTANYISTIFRQKIIPSICDAARIHAEIIENLPYPENFKVCKTCGQILLINTDNFVRKARAADGFSNQCKRCDKEARQMAKEKIK